MLGKHFLVALAASVTFATFVPGSVFAGGARIQNPANPSATTKPTHATSNTTANPGKVETATSAPKDPRLTLPAKKLFGHERRAADMVPRSIGFYSKGCLAGAKMLQPTGPYWQAMRLSRNRNWAHPATVALLEKLATDIHHKDGISGLLVGDLTQPRGGPMLTGHKSHQIGLDADVWLRAMPDRVLSRKEREVFQPISMLKNALKVDPKKFTDKIVALIKRAASYPEVSRVGVNPAIKHALCKAAGGDKPWLSKIQGWAGHHYHMHIRLKCPSGSTGCKGQSPPTGTSCATSEKWYRNLKAWMELPKSKRKPKKKTKKRKPKPPITLAGLPDACRTVLSANAPDSMEALIILPVQKPAPAPTLATRQPATAQPAQ